MLALQLARHAGGATGRVDAFQIFSRRPEMMIKIRQMLKDQKGATAIEYGLIAALVAVAAITAMSSLGSQLNTTLTKVKTTMENGRA